MQESELELVKLDQAPAPEPVAPRVVIKSDVIAFSGSVIAQPEDLRARATRTPEIASKPFVLVIDDDAPWKSVAGVVSALAPRTLHLAFAAGGKPHAARPASSIDKRLEAEDRRRENMTFARALEEPFPPFSGEVYASCATAREALRTAFDADDKVAAMKQLLPPAVAACGCKVEIPAAKKLLWRLWGRDHGSPFAWVTIEAKPGGAAVTSPPETPWREAHPLVVAAARDGKPVELR